MFTGLVEEVGVIRRLRRTTEGGSLVIGAHRVLEATNVGDSICVSGACLTVVSLGERDFTAECMPETLSRTTLGEATPGSEVNLERALSFGERLGGHLVTGHVDAVARVLAVERKGTSLEVRVSLPDEVRAYVADKGSVAVDGISLTVIRVESESFVVGLIPHTLAGTTLGHASEGLLVNVEADVIARYVRRSLEAYRGAPSVVGSPAGGLTEELLREKGFA